MRLLGIVLLSLSVAVFAQTSQTAPMWYVSGQVMMDDGRAPPEPVLIQTVCNGIAHTAAATDSRGFFSFQVGGADNGMAQDASVGRTDAALGRTQSPLAGPGWPTPTVNPYSNQSSAQQSGATDSQPTGRLPSVERTLDYCELQARLPGYVAASVSLLNRRPADDPSVGTLILRRIGSLEGRTVSATTLAAPKAARSAYENGRKAAARNKLEEARSLFEKAVGLYPQFAPAWASLGDIQVKQEQPENAARSFENAIQADPKYVQPYLGLALVEASQRQWERLTATTAQALKLDPFDYPLAHCLNALGNYNTRNLEAAEKSAREAERLDSGRRWPQSWRLLGSILASRHAFMEAADQFREYLRIAPLAADADLVRKELARVEELARR